MQNKRIRLSPMELFLLFVIALSLAMSFFQARREEHAVSHVPRDAE